MSGEVGCLTNVRLEEEGTEDSHEYFSSMLLKQKRINDILGVYLNVSEMKSIVT